MRTLGCLVLVAMLLAGLCHAAAGFSISPFKARLMPGVARGDSEVFQLNNTASEPQAVEMRIERWRLDENGNEFNEPDVESFEVYPRQFVLQPKATQAVRVRWKNGAVASEQAFRLIAEQLPVDFTEDVPAGSLRFLVVYRAALYVSPAKPKAQVDVESFSEDLMDGVRRLRLVLRNNGNAHTLLRNPVLSVSDASGTAVKMDGAQVEALDGQNIHAGMRRMLMLPWPEGLQGELKAVQLEFTPEF